MRLVAVAAAVALFAAAAPALASDRHPTQGELERELVCPTCHTTLDESDAPIARQMKAEIRRRIAQGATKSQIEQELVDEFGPSVLGVPRKHGFDLLAWALPLGGVGVAAAGLAFGAWRWSRARDVGDTVSQAPSAAPLDPELDRRVDEELARFDA
ncbi:MAG TPA: cytochrome c-type biogenesis protein CcmH [Gaiellaceae bacterium]|nr:cytochrome c-type biogenesis protein CcmH [Gaiellaceae bacterium]